MRRLWGEEGTQIFRGDVAVVKQIKSGCKALSFDTLISVRRSEHNKVFCTDQECRRGLSSARPLLSRSISSLALVSTPALTLRFSSWLSTHVVADFPEVRVTRLPILIYI